MWVVETVASGGIYLFFILYSSPTLITLMTTTTLMMQEKNTFIGELKAHHAAFLTCFSRIQNF